MNTFEVTIALPLGMAVTGCDIATDRTGYPDAWYYERLTIYYENTLSTNPRVLLRAVEVFVGHDIVQADGSVVHVDYFREDIEIFFAAPVAANDVRLRLARFSIRETCPQSDLADLEDHLAYSSKTYLVFQDVPCSGYAS